MGCYCLFMFWVYPAYCVFICQPTVIGIKMTGRIHACSCWLSYLSPQLLIAQMTTAIDLCLLKDMYLTLPLQLYTAFHQPSLLVTI